jgi:hypothetical protein
MTLSERRNRLRYQRMEKLKHCLLASQFGAFFFLIIINFLAYFRISEIPQDFPRLETLNDWIGFNLPWWMGLSIFFFLTAWFRKSKGAA